MPTTNKRSGKASSLTWKGTALTITKYTPTTTRTLADATASDDYDATSNMLWETQIPVKLAQELKIEGKYNVVTTPSTVIADLYTGNAAAAVVLGIDAGTLLGHGNYDISSFEAGVPIDDIVTYTCTAKLNGIFTPNA